jgi:polyisoprenoid-binding protein YceI
MHSLAPMSPVDNRLTPGDWTLDHAHSSLAFSIRHLGLSKVHGRFDHFEATLHVGAEPGQTTVEVSVDLASIDTNNADRDTHLRSTDFFNVGEHPRMTFRSQAIAPSGDGYDVDGEVMLNGVTRPMTLHAEFNGVLESPVDHRPHAGVSAAGELRRSEFGIEFGLMPLGVDRLALADQVRFDVELQFVAPASAPD